MFILCFHIHDLWRLSENSGLKNMLSEEFSVRRFPVQTVGVRRRKGQRRAYEGLSSSFSKTVWRILSVAYRMMQYKRRLPCNEECVFRKNMCFYSSMKAPSESPARASFHTDSRIISTAVQPHPEHHRYKCEDVRRHARRASFVQRTQHQFLARIIMRQFDVSYHRFPSVLEQGQDRHSFFSLS